MANKKISQLTPKGTPIASTDLVEIAEDDGAGGYVTKSVSGLQPTLVSGTVSRPTHMRLPETIISYLSKFYEMKN